MGNRSRYISNWLTMWRQETNSAFPEQVRQRRRVLLLGYLAGVATLALLTVAFSTVTSPVDGRARSPFVDLRAVPDSVLRRPHVVVLEIGEADFRDLANNPGQRGRHWERLGRAAFLADGKLTFETPVGVRIHGGSSRFLPLKSLRLFFRRSINATRPAAADVGLAGDMRYESLILHGDVRPDTGTLEFHYSNPIAYTVAERMGVMTARTLPMSLVMNGGPPVPYVLSEHLGPEVIGERLGHKNIRVYNLRDDADKKRLETEGPLAELTARYGGKENWTRERIGEVVDLDNLSRWFITLMFCGTRDLAQGMLVHDPERVGAKWFWVAWDLDMSFTRLEADIAPRAETFHLNVLIGNSGKDADMRRVLLRHLVKTSPSFRRDFVALFETARDSLITPAFLDETLVKYEHAAAVNGITDARYQVIIRDFLARRATILTEQLRTKFEPSLN
jgi:hypothetical protein